MWVCRYSYQWLEDTGRQWVFMAATLLLRSMWESVRVQKLVIKIGLLRTLVNDLLYAMSTTTYYLAVLKASYSYSPQSHDELALVQDQTLLLVRQDGQ